MKETNLIVIHCSATREDRCFTEHDLEECHRRRGFEEAGYHLYTRKDGKIVATRPVERTGAHTKGFNTHSTGICYEGGLDYNGRPRDTRTEWQKYPMRVLAKVLLEEYPGSRVCGYRDLSLDLNEDGGIEPEEWIKARPCFEVKEKSSQTHHRDSQSLMELSMLMTRAHYRLHGLTQIEKQINPW